MVIKQRSMYGMVSQCVTNSVSIILTICIDVCQCNNINSMHHITISHCLIAIQLECCFMLLIMILIDKTNCEIAVPVTRNIYNINISVQVSHL